MGQRTNNNNNNNNNNNARAYSPLAAYSTYSSLTVNRGGSTTDASSIGPTTTTTRMPLNEVDDEIRRKDMRKQLRKTRILDAYDRGENANFPSSAHEEYVESYLDVSFDVPPTYFYFALLSVLFFPPVGCMALWHARKGSLQALYTPYGMRTVTERSNQAHRFATLAVVYGVVFWTALGIVFGLF